jgi:uncharacterized protein (DUF433 family)
VSVPCARSPEGNGSLHNVPETELARGAVCRLFPASTWNTLKSMSDVTQTLWAEIQSSPEPVQRELLDFLLFVKSRQVLHKSGVEKTDGVCGGDPCIASTRIPVWSLEQSRKLGLSDEAILRNYPSLRQQDLAAAWEYVRSHRSEIEQAILQNEEA